MNSDVALRQTAGYLHLTFGLLLRHTERTLAEDTMAIV